jgi:dihydrofolate reductase
MVSSLDGFIAKKDGSVSWLDTSDTYEPGMTEESGEAFIQTIDCFVMGARTYEHALALSREFGWPYGEVPTLVLTHRALPADRASIEFYAGDLQTLVNDRLKPHYRNIWLVGGAMLVKEFLRLGLVDDIRQTIVPIILGDGTPFFDRIGQEQALPVRDVTASRKGMVDLWYEVRKG